MNGKSRKISELAAEWMADPGFRAEYAALDQEFAIAEALIEARAGLTQEQVAERMGTSRTAVARLEGGRGNPSLRTLQRYAAATGRRLRISFDAISPSV